MTAPSLSLTTEPAIDVAADVLVIGVTAGKEGGTIVGVEAVAGSAFADLQGSLDSIGFSGSKDDVRRLPWAQGGARSIALVGLGSEQPDANSLRNAAGAAARVIRGAETIAIALPTTTDAEVLAVLEGAAIGSYTFTEYRSAQPEPGARLATRFVVVSDAARSTELIARATAVATAMHTVRDLVNTPPSDLYPETFAAAASALSEGLPVELTVLDEAGLAAGGFGGILGVGQGSSRGPRLVKVSYTPEGAESHLALVGKGITFDTGGLSLKPPASMVGMKYDMTGAATALAVVLAAARLELPIRLTAWLCLAENMPSATATRPNDVLRIRGGKTVEVLNTDAEGRLVLADGLVAASEEHPDAIVDVATLTGAASVAMGTRYVATMGDDDLARRVVAAGDRVGEALWQMPLPGELRALLDSDIADLANVKIGNTAGGMLIAGVFLKEFVGRTADDSRQIPWAHLDIAGAANNSGAAHGYVGKGPTGVAVRALLELAEDLSRG
ncbi:MAG: aminopeptidase [Microbacteriaceae bacterium]|jgi:leucyl aminopeptidase|nr:aminopeptidase [Microbacteriaceae bacterium]HEV7956943.1 leucyl aminopeptidase [Marisediminicola sp.]